MRSIIIILLAAGIVMLLILTPHKEQTPQDKAIEAVKGWLLQRLDDPDSYEPGKFIVDQEGNGWDIDHEYRAKNKFGALVKDQISVYVDSTYKVSLPEEMK